MTTTPTEFKALFPEFSESEDSFITAWSVRAAIYVSAETFGDNYQHALELMTAHLLKQATHPDGPTISSRVGDISEGFALPANWYDGLKATVYGRQLLSLARQTAPFMMTSALPSIPPKSIAEWPPAY